MSALTVTGNIGSGQTALDQGIGDIMVAQTDAGVMLFTISGPAGGVAAYLVGSDGALTLQDSAYFDGAWVGGTMSGLTLVEGSDGASSLIIATDEADGLVGLAVQADGTFGTTGFFVPDAALPPVIGLSQWGDDMLFVSSADQPGISGYAIGADDGLSLQFSVPDSATTYASSVFALETARVGDQDFLIGACQAEGGVTAYRIDGTGLMATGSMGAAEGLGIMTPTDMALAEVDGTTFVLLASAPGDGIGQSGAVTVMELAGDGSLTPTDHVIDTGDTRFGATQSIEAIDLDGRTYVLAAGGDGGLTAFVLMPNGRLLLTDVIADPPSGGLDNVTAIAAVAAGDGLHVFVSSQTGPGLTTLTLDASGQGQTRMVDGIATGGAGNDILIGGVGDDTISGGAGDDVLEDGAGTDHLTGGSGADLFSLRADASHDIITDFDWTEDRLDLSDWPFFYDPASLTIHATAFGATVIWRGETLDLHSETGQSLSAAQVLGSIMSGVHRPPNLAELGATAGDQTLVGSPFGDVIHGGAGHDTIDGANGDDTLFGDSGFDEISGGEGDDLVDGGGEADILYGGAGDDTILGGDGADRIEGGAGRDSIEGGNGRDIIAGEAGDDTVRGGDGNDYIMGQGGDDLIAGDAGEDELFGGGGFDTIDGGAGEDIIHGGANADLLSGGAGDDTIEGGRGADRIWGDAGHDHLQGDSGDDRIWGGAGDDVITGGSGFDVIAGDDGNDLIDGGSNADDLSGGDGDDTLIGGDGADQLRGDAGADRLEGGAGDDLLIGGGDADVFVFADGHGEDSIVDFDAGDGSEVIDLSGVTALTGIADLLGPGGGATQLGTDVRIDTGGGVIWLLDTSLVDLDATDFLF